MKAIVNTGGGADGLMLREVDEPTPRAGQLLIDVSLAGVNYADLIGLSTGNNFLGGKPGDEIPGGEVVGRRVDTGERVVAICGSGGYAQRVAASADQVFAIPADVDDAAALALFIQGLTAWHIVVTLGQQAKGARMLIPSAAGGVGLLALQIARYKGAARIVATASSPAKRALALDYGADAAIADDADDFTAASIAANDGQRFDLVLDRAGGTLFAQSLAATAARGRIICYGTSSGTPGKVATSGLLAGSRTVSGFWLMDFLAELPAAFGHLHALHRAGDLRTHIGSVLPLANAAAAHRAVAARETVGKILLDPRKVA